VAWFSPGDKELKTSGSVHVGNVIKYIAKRSDCAICPLQPQPGSHVPYKSLVELRATYMPDAVRAAFRSAPELIPEEGSPPGFDIV